MPAAYQPGCRKAVPSSSDCVSCVRDVKLEFQSAKLSELPPSPSLRLAACVRVSLVANRYIGVSSGAGFGIRAAAKEVYTPRVLKEAVTRIGTARTAQSKASVSSRGADDCCPRKHSPVEHSDCVASRRALSKTPPASKYRRGLRRNQPLCRGVARLAHRLSLASNLALQIHIINRITRGGPLAHERKVVCAHGTIMQLTIALLPILTALVSAESILMTEVFIIPIKPETFEWTGDGRADQFSYQPSLLNAPDLPSWIHYTYGKRDHQGFLYGVAPKGQKYFQLGIVGLNKQTYETRYKLLDISVLEKENLTKYEAHLKIDNLNVEDMFDRNRTEDLLDIFRKKLWKRAADLYVTFLASAVELGARLPLKPSEGEGVVIRLGSSVPFSQELNELQEEVKPLWKLPSCPREFKRTSVERLFREARFTLDWCSFRLLQQDQQSLQHESARRGPSMNVVGLPSAGLSEHSEWRWARPTKASVPTRSYFKEIITTIFVPGVLMLILAALLSTAFCLHHEKMNDPVSDKYFHELFNIFLKGNHINREKRQPTPVEGVGNNSIQMVQYASTGGGTLRSLSIQPPSPSDSLLRSPRISGERCNPYLRPNPPPYTGPSNLGGIRSDF